MNTESRGRRTGMAFQRTRILGDAGGRLVVRRSKEGGSLLPKAASGGYCGKSRKPRTDENCAVARHGSFAPIDRLRNRLAWSYTGVARSRPTRVAQFSRSVPTAQGNVIDLKESTSSTISAQSFRRATDLSSRHLPLGYGYLPCHVVHFQRRSVSSHSPSPLIDADQNHSPTGADALAGGRA